MKREASILVVDPDGVSRRLVELKLGGRGWSIESAKDGRSALEILRASRVAAVLCELALPDMAGLQLHRRLMQENRLRSIPFVVLTADDRVDSQVAAFKAGIDDYLIKPYDPRVLTVRVETLIARAMRARLALANRTYLLAGDFAVLPLPDLVSTLSLQRRTGTLFIAAEQAMGEVHLAEGEVVHAVFGNLSGEPAVQALFGETEANFEFSPRETALPQEGRTIRTPVTALFMEAARLHDESQAQKSRPSAVVEPASELGPPIPKDNSTQARQVVAGIQSEFSLGELMMWVGRELETWVKREYVGPRVHVHLVSELSLGVSALLSLATPATERQLLGGLKPGSKTMGLAFFLRGGQLIDLVLIDIHSPAASSHSLSRSPTVTIIAPPGGDALAIGPQSLVGLNALLRLRPPELLVGLGGPNLEATILRLAGTSCPSLYLKGTLGEGRDLRGVLSESVLHWGNLAAETAERT